MRRKILSVLVSLSMVLTLVPSAAFAGTASTNDSANEAVKFTTQRMAAKETTGTTSPSVSASITSDLAKISGTLNEAIAAGQTIVLSLEDGTFTDVAKNDETLYELVDAPAGISIKSATAGTTNNTVVLEFEGTPTTSVSGAVKVAIKAGAIEGVTDVITATGSVVWGIIEDTGEEFVFSGTTYTISGAKVGTAIEEIDVAADVTGGTKPYTFELTGAPAGIEISASGIISGTPTEATSAAVEATIKVTDSAEPANSGTATLTVEAIADESGETPSEFVASIADASVVLKGDAPASITTQVEITGGAEGATYTYTVDETTVPEWAEITVAADGTITCTATAAGNADITIIVSDGTTSVEATFNFAATSEGGVEVPDNPVDSRITIEDVTIDGIVGEDLVDKSITVNIADAEIDSAAASDRNNYIVNTPGGVVVFDVEIPEATADTTSTSIVLNLSGAPAAAKEEGIVVAVKAGVIVGVSEDRNAAENANAVWAIVEAEEGELTFEDSNYYNIPSGVVKKAITSFDVSGAVSGGTKPYTFTLENAPEWLTITEEGVVSGTRPDTVADATTAIIRVTDAAGASKTIEIAVGAVTKTSSSSSSGGGGGGGGTTSVTSSADDNDGVEIEAKASGSTVTIEDVNTENISDGIVTLDLTSIRENVRSVKLNFSAFRKLYNAVTGNRDTDGIAFKLSTGVVEFDETALESIVDQANGSDIQLDLESTGVSRLNNVQRQAISSMEIHAGFRITLNSKSAIVDFNGGSVSISVPFTVPSGKESTGFSIFHVSDRGVVTKMPTKFSGGFLTFTTTHFSDYMVAYEAETDAATEPTTTVCDGGSDCPSRQFVDIDTNAWYHLAVDYAVTKGLMNGVGGSSFAPNANLSRAMLAQILYNQEGTPAVSSTADFTDVAEGMWYTNAIAWASANRIVSGYGDGQFGPNDNITREQLAVMLYRYAGSPSANGSVSSFVDADDISEYAVDAMVWAVSNEIMKGKGANNLDPSGLATRAEVAQMLKNYLDK